MKSATGGEASVNSRRREAPLKFGDRIRWSSKRAFVHHSRSRPTLDTPRRLSDKVLRQAASAQLAPMIPPTLRTRDQIIGSDSLCFELTDSVFPVVVPYQP